MPILRRALLRTHSEPFAGVVQLLDHLDTTRLMVYALEYDDLDTANLLRDHSPWCPFLEMHLLHFAAAHGCLRAVLKLRKGAKQATGKPFALSEAGNDNYDPRAQLMTWVNAFRAYRYPEGVMYEAAKQGDLDVVRWLHSTSKYTSFLAVEHAATSGQLAIAQWLAEHADDNTINGNGHSSVSVEVTVPFDEDLGIFAWRASNAATDMYSEANKHYLRTLVRRRGFVWVAQGQPRIASIKTGSAYPSSSAMQDPVLFAVEEGSLELLEVLHKSKNKYQWLFSQQVLVDAVSRGHLDVLQWLLDNEVSEYSVAELVATAMDSNQVEILKWLDTTYQLEEVPFQHVRNAVQGGRLEAVIWAYERFLDLPCDEEALCLHKEFCPASVAMWLHEHKGLGLNSKMLSSFIRQGDLSLLKSFLSSLESDDERIIEFVFDEACESSSLEIVRYLAETRGRWSDRAAHVAGSSGSVDVVRWILSTGREGWSLRQEPVLRFARLGEWELLRDFAVAGRITARIYCFWRFPASRLEQAKVDYSPHFLFGRQHKDWDWVPRLVSWLLTNFPAKIHHARSLGAWATQHGHTSIVLQLIDAEYPTIFATANFKRILQSSSHSEDLASLAQVFLERRPELLSYRVFQWSAERNQRALLRFLFSLITERDVGSVVNFVKSVQVVVTTASKLGYLGLLKWVHLNISRAPMSPWPSARHGHVHILNWLHANGILDEPKLDAAIRTSVRFGHLEVLQWYERTYHGSEYRFCAKELQEAVRRQDVETVEWILRRQPELKDAAETGVECELASLLTRWTKVEHLNDGQQ